MPDQPTDPFNLKASFHTAGAFREKEDDPIELSPPSGLAFTPEGDLILADDFNHRIQIYGKNRKVKLTFGEKGQEDGQLNYPRGVAVDKEGFIYVTDSWNHRVQKFDGSGQHVLTFGGYGNEAGQINEPYDVMVEPSGRIIVVERYNHRIQFFDPNGISQGWLGSRAIVLEDRLAWIYETPPALFPRPVFELPTAIAKDSRGNFFIADSGNHRIVKFDPNWKLVQSFGTQGAGPGEFQYPLGVEVGHNDLIYVADLNNNRVQVFDSCGQFLFILTEGAKTLETPCLTRIGPDGQLYVGMTFHTHIEVFKTPQGSRQELRNQGSELHPENFKIRFCQGQSLEEEQDANEAYAKAASLLTQTPHSCFPPNTPLAEDAFIAPIRWIRTISDNSLNPETEELLLKCLAFYDAGMDFLADEMIQHQEKWIGCTEDVSNKLVAEENLILQQKDDPLKFNRKLYNAETEEKKLFQHMRTLFWFFRHRAERRAEFTDILMHCGLSEKSINRCADALKKRYLAVCGLIQTCLDDKEKREEVMVAEFGNGVNDEKKWRVFRSKFISNQKTFDVLKQLQHEFRMVLKQIAVFEQIRSQGESLLNHLFLEFPQASSLHKILMGYQEDWLGYHGLEQDVLDVLDTWIYRWGDKIESPPQTVTLDTLVPIPYDREETVLEENLHTLIAEGTTLQKENGDLRFGHKIYSASWRSDRIGDLTQQVSSVFETMKTYEENLKEIFDNLEGLTRQRSELGERLKKIDPRDKRAPIPLRNNTYVLSFQIGLLYRMIRTLEINELNNVFRLVLGGAILATQSNGREGANALFGRIRNFQTDSSRQIDFNLKKKKELFFEKADLDNQLRTEFSAVNPKAFEERTIIQNRLVEKQLELDRLHVVLNKQLRIQNLLQKLLNFVDVETDKKGSPERFILQSKGTIWGPSYDRKGFLGCCNVAVSSDGIVYIVDHIKHTVYRMTSEGKILGFFGGYGNGPGLMQWPKNIQVGQNGNIYISEGTNRCMHVFSAEGRYLFRFGNTGDRSFGLPNDISSDGQDNIWVTDTLKHCIQVFSSGGRFLKTFTGTGEGTLKEPTGICCLDDDRVAIADRSGYLVKLFSTEGDFIKGLKKEYITENELFTLTYDSHFGILGPDSWTPQIIQLSPDLETVSTFSQPGRRMGQFGVIPGLAVHKGLFYVTDYENSKVVIFEPTG